MIIIIFSFLFFFFYSHKADKFFEGHIVIIQRHDISLDLLYYFKKYLASHDQLFPFSSDLWLCADGSRPSWSFFIQRMKIFFDTNIAGQSMRSGGATSLAENGVPPILFKLLVVGHPQLSKFISEKIWSSFKHCSLGMLLMTLSLHNSYFFFFHIKKMPSVSFFIFFTGFHSHTSVEFNLMSPHLVYSDVKLCFRLFMWYHIQGRTHWSSLKTVYANPMRSTSLG